MLFSCVELCLGALSGIVSLSLIWEIWKISVLMHENKCIFSNDILDCKDFH